MKKKTTEDFINEARKVHGEKYDYSKTEYKGIFEKVTVICPVHGEFEQTAHNHLRGNGCPKCSDNRWATIKNERAKKTFIERAIEKTNGKYDLSEADYVNAKEKIKVICHKKDTCGNEHGPFYITPSNLLSLYGCPKCAHEEISVRRRLPYEQFQNSIDKKYGEGLYTVDRTSYENSPYNTKIYCNTHKKYFVVSPRDFPRATIYRCPECREDIKLVVKERERLSRKERYHKNRTVTAEKLEQPELDENIRARINNGEEVWVPVRRHSRYMVSSEGRVKIVNRVSRAGRPLPDYLCALTFEKNGRRVVTSIDGKCKSIHKIVFESFYNMDIPKGYELTIDHLDTNPMNNSVLNLRLCRGIKDNMVNNPLTMMHICKESKSKGVSPMFEFEKIEGEIWKPCVGYEGLYCVSNIGRVKAEKRVLIEQNTGVVRTKKEHLMRLHLKDGRAYTVGMIGYDGSHKNNFVHRLVYQAFVGDIPDGYEIDHIDSDSKNNNLNNLRACTHKMNVSNPNSKRKRVPSKKARGVGLELKDGKGNTIKTFSSLRDCATYFNVHSNSIGRIVNGYSTGKRVLSNGEKLARIE